MLKRMTAWVLVIALLASVMPMSIAAEGEPTYPAPNSHSAEQHNCEHCDGEITWEAWGDTDTEKKTLPTASGHYYLVSDIEKTAKTEMAATADIVLCLNGYTIDGNSTDTIYRVVTSGKLRIDDCTAYTDAEGVYHAGKLINGKNTGGVGGTFYVNGTSTLTMTAGIVSDSQNLRTTTDLAYGGGALHLRNTAQVTLENVVFENCYTTKDGGVISKRDAGTQLTVKNCTFKNNTADTSGGVAFIQSGGATFENCTFTGNTAGTGSVLYVRNGGLVTLKDCVFEKNTAKSGASGVFYIYGSKVDLDGCTVKDNVANGNGGSVIYTTYTSTVNIKDTTITGNKFTGTSSGSRAAIYITKAEDKVTLAGKVVIDDNFAATDGTAIERGIFMQAANQLDVGGLTDGSYVEIWSHTWAVDSADDIVTAATAPTSWKRTWVVHENSGMAVEYDAEKGFYFAINTDHVHCECGNSACTDTTHKKVEYLAWNTADALPTSGNYYLNTEVTLAAETNVTADLNLCLNGHTVTAASGKRHMSTPKDAEVSITIADCTAQTVDGVYTAGKLIGGVDKGSGQGGGAIYIRTGGTLKIYDGIFTDNTSITGGGAVRMNPDTTLYVYGGEFKNNTAVTADGKTWKNGGAISAMSGSEVQILGGTFTGNKGAQGGALYSEGKKLVVKDAEITDNYAYNNAGGIYAKIADTTITNTTFTGNYGTKDGGALYYREGNIEVIDCVFTDNESKTVGAGINFSGNAIATITGGTFEGGVSTSGSAVFIQGGASATVNGGTYKNNTVTSYGGAFSLYNGVLTVTGGSQITGNTAKRGGAIDLRETSTLVLKDCSITGNTASSGGAVYVNDKSTVTLEGAPQIMANQGGNLYLMDAEPIKVGTLADTANVCVTGNPGAFTEACSDYAQYFAADSKYLKVEYVEGALHLAAGGEHKHCLCDSTNTHCDHINIAWVAWESTNSLPTSGSYYLLYDVQLTDEVSISKDLNLCLNGHTITAAENKRILSNPSNTEVTISITDCTAVTVDGVYTAGKLTGGHDTGTAGGGAIYLRAGGNLNLFEGIITGNQSNVAAGALLVTTNTVTNIYGGEISENTAVNGETMKPGGAIYAMKGAEVNVLGGVFKNNSGYQGGAIWVDGSASKLTVTGGTFADNTASVNGAAIYGKGSAVTISGGTFTGNTSVKDGGAVYSREGNLDITGNVLFSGNESTTGAGGAVSYSGANTGTVSGGTFENNKAGSGGAMIIQGGSNVTIKDVTIRNNVSRGYSGGIYLHASTLTIENAAISGNEASQGGAIGATSEAVLNLKGGDYFGNSSVNAGGAVWVGGNSQAVISGGTYRDNTAGGNAGGIYGKQADMKITGGTISGNYGAKDGGGVYFREGNMDITGEVLITGNTSKTVGGGVCYSGEATGTISDGVVIEKNVAGSGGGMIVQGKANVKMTGGTIRNHSVTGSGGGVYLHNSTFTMTGGSITGNKAKVGGGGLYINQEGALFVIDGGTISKNSTKNGGGMLVVNKATVELKSGKITGNTTQNGSGGGAYISTNSFFKMTGGSVTNNHVTGAGGGLYGLQATLTVSGGSISGNNADGAGGAGIYLNGATLIASGLSITGNTTKGNGGGIGSARRVIKKNGVETSYPCNIYVSGSYIAGNSAKIAGGVIMNGNGGKLEMSGTTITNNKATNQAGGLYVSAKCTATIKNSTITNNESAKSGGGLYFNKPTVTMENSKVVGNTAASGAGGGIYAYRGTVADFKNVTFADNTCTTVGGGVYGDSNTDYYTEVAFEDCTFTGNTAGTRGGGFYGSFGVEFDAVNCLFENNTAVGGGTDTTTGNGGAIAIRDIARLKDCTFKGNKAQKGGAFYGGNMQLTYAVNGWGVKADDVAVTMENCTFEGNNASETGGAIHNAMSSFATLTDCSFTGNSAGLQGSAIYAEDDFKMIGATVTGNVSGSNGYALYYADSEFDGMNYIRGLFKLGGDIIVKDNQGGDVYMDNMVTITMTGEGLGPKTHIEVTLDKGVLTQRVIGAYNYEGGDQVYTVTYGDRSLTDPEVDESLIQEEAAAEQTEETKAASQDTWLYVGVGVIAVAILAVVALLLAKKKKAKVPADASKE